MIPNWGELIFEQAMKDLGIHEQPMGSNAGPEVDDFLAFVRLPPGNPWCAAYRCWLVHHVLGVNHYVPDPHVPLIYTGSTGELVMWAKGHGKIVQVPQKGDAVCVKGNTRTGYEHTATFGKLYPFGMIHTIDGNWGDRIAYAWHHVSECTFVREWL